MMQIRNLILKPDFAEIKTVRENFRIIATMESIDIEDEYYLELVIGEVLANAMEHGIEMETAKNILFNMKINEEEVMFEVIYDGNIITEEQAKEYEKDPVVDELDELLTSGRGIFLIHKIMDRVEYYQNKNNVRIVMIKKCNINMQDKKM